MMRPEFQDLLELMFEDGESVCVSHNKYGYHSVPVRDLDLGAVELVSPNKGILPAFKDADDMLMLALNPIKGFRLDDNCTSFRTFMVELDDGALEEQLRYVKSMGMPYSVCVFSGSKSLHFGITLDEDLPSQEVYRFYSRYILRVMDKADQATFNPSRSIRVPGAIRDGQKQRLIEMKGRVPLGDLKTWLSRFPDKAPPVESEPRRYDSPPGPASEAVKGLKKWMQEALCSGVPSGIKGGRNRTWYAIACELSLHGYSYYDIIEILEGAFSPESDFSRQEWERTIKSASERFK